MHVFGNQGTCRVYKNSKQIPGIEVVTLIGVWVNSTKVHHIGTNVILVYVGEYL